jgi:hypothetical protein
MSQLVEDDDRAPHDVAAAKRCQHRHLGPPSSARESLLNMYLFLIRSAG